MNIVDEADVHQLINVMLETKETVHLYFEVFEGWAEQTEAVDKIVPYNVRNIVSDNVEECPQEETVAMNTVDEENLYEFGRLCAKSLSNNKESNEGWADAIGVSIENIFPHTHHGVCAFHLLGNIVHRFGKHDKTKVLFWRLVRAYKRNVFEGLRYRFSSTRPQVAAYLSEIPRAKWTKAYSPSKRYDYMTSNNAESMNALFVDARKMPIIPLLEFFRRLSHEWCNKRHIDEGKRSTLLTEWAEKVVGKNEEHMTAWSVSGVSDAIYQVHDFKHGGIGDKMQETYTRKYWEGTSLPCGHVIMVLKHLKKTNFGHLAIDAYKMKTYRSTYEEAVYPLPEPCDWEIPEDMIVVKPPIMDTHQAGRLKNKNRIPSHGEEPIVRRCSRCDSTIHNTATCLTLVPMMKKKPRKSSVASGSKAKRKGTQGTQETLKTHETRWMQGTQRENYCSMFYLND
uniref:Zinc finger PMZ-type domain-containing protein n=1 Tax=Lactuca sativa TaxID=4236 RepID=A0A9R1VZG2_LACSA|nr:hypothetical protein LSAT_V11C400171770 [Lactuca sativa]